MSNRFMTLTRTARRARLALAASTLAASMMLATLLPAPCFADAPASPDARDVALIARMTLAEKVNQLMLLSKGTMTGPDSAGRPNKSAEELAREGVGFQMSAFEWSSADVNRIQRIAVKESRLGIPVVFATDIIHGYWTVFPVPLGLAATFDAADARVVAGISGLEGYSHGQRWTFAPMVDHPADPRWGRVVETFGESPLVSSDYAVATIRGFHTSLANLPGHPAPVDFGVASCLKHYLGYGGVRGGKDYAYVDASERTLREFHLPPYAAGIAAGAPTVMPAFTTGSDGVPMSANRHWLRDVLRGELGFDGLLVSDYAAITEMRNHGTAADDLDAAVQALRNGTMSVDMEDGVYYAQLARAVSTGRLRVEEIDREVLRVLAFKRKLGLFETPYVPEDLEKRVRLSAEHRAAARGIARKSIVLLKNDTGLLPLKAKRILVTGPLADAQNDLLGPWHARGNPKDVVSVLQGIRERATSGNAAIVTYAEGVGLDVNGNSADGDEARIKAAVASARDSDVIVAVVGERESMSGEAKNRAHLDLPGKQQALVDALLGTGKPVVVILLTGRALAVPSLVEKSGALVHAFFPGVEGGHALADVLFGDYNPGGKEPVTWPRSVGQLPIHHYDPPSGRPNIPERGDYKAHWLDESDSPLFPFGFGLSYSSFTLTSLELPERVGRGGTLKVRVRLTNTSAREGDEVPQLYIRPRVASTATGKRLQAYRRIHLAGGQSQVVEFMLPAANMAVLDAQNRWTLEPGVFEVLVGTSSSDGLAGTFAVTY
ncbi:MAG TPA: glycoside hydrolase family 3 N-terminal domain-containing protein [Steroidobacteraceae bacterium]|jgi:beta-glucosidase|nr:glycoside hydrolase family 3 N-terminal domain-containing protein [Steroidobacteraceae bacterium]